MAIYKVELTTKENSIPWYHWLLDSKIDIEGYTKTLLSVSKQTKGVIPSSAKIIIIE
jgi:hypothetical protein